MASVLLEGAHVRLEPLALSHLPDLLIAAEPSDETFRWFPEPLDSPAALRGWIDRALADQQAGTALPFAIRRLRDHAVVGSTRFGAIVAEHARAEIGSTWLAPRARRSAVNTECKLLLLEHGFGALALNRVELKTDSLNTASRTAILRIGATQEGIFRNHMQVPGPRLRHSVWFSIIRDEWPAVRDRLKAFLSQPELIPAPLFNTSQP